MHICVLALKGTVDELAIFAPFDFHNVLALGGEHLNAG
jgi:hypothetical protein